MDETLRSIRSIIDNLNSQLGEYTPYKLDIVPMGDLHPATKNARFMSKRTFDQLTDNIRQDRALSSVPFCWKTKDGYKVLSGNHRLEAAQAAGIDNILILYTDEDLTRDREIAIQLSHNALTGEDNPQVLADLWAEMSDLRLKIYSGLDDKFLETLPDVKLQRLQEEDLRFEELTWLFVPSEIDRIKQVIERVEKSNHLVLLCPVETFDRFFSMLLDYKDLSNIINTGTAILSIIEIVEDWLEQHKVVEEYGHNGQA